MDDVADASNLLNETWPSRKTRLIALIEIEDDRKIVRCGDSDNWMPVWSRVSDRRLERNIAVWCLPSPLIDELLSGDRIATQRPGQAIHAAGVALALNAEALLGSENTFCNGAIQLLSLSGKSNFFRRWHMGMSEWGLTRIRRKKYAFIGAFFPSNQDWRWGRAARGGIDIAHLRG